MPFRFFLLLCLTLFALVSCSTDDILESDAEIKEEVEQQLPVDVLYNDAMDLLEERRYEKAAEQFEEIEREHPYSKWATRAQVMSAFAYYKHQAFEDSISIIKRFIRLHPGHEMVGYMYYLRAINYYDQIADVQHDQDITRLAKQTLHEVINRFSNTDYARDARVKLDLVYDHLAGKEMEVGRFYSNKGQNLAAIKRFKIVLDKYETTSHTPEALYRLAATYYMMGVLPEAKKYAAVLGHNYPHEKWYHYAYDLFHKSPTMPKPKAQNWWKKGIKAVESTIESTVDLVVPEALRK